MDTWDGRHGSGHCWNGHKDTPDTIPISNTCHCDAHHSRTPTQQTKTRGTCCKPPFHAARGPRCWAFLCTELILHDWLVKVVLRCLPRCLFLPQAIMLCKSPAGALAWHLFKYRAAGSRDMLCESLQRAISCQLGVIGMHHALACVGRLAATIPCTAATIPCTAATIPCTGFDAPALEQAW